MLEVVRVPGWERYDWLRHGFSTRLGGLSTVYATSSTKAGDDLNLGFTSDDDPAAVLGNRQRILQAIGGAEAFALVTARQVHGTSVYEVRASEAGSLMAPDGRGLIEADGLMTSSPGVMLGVQAADCVPILVADIRHRVVAGFHAGWRGTVAGMAAHGVERLAEAFGSAPADLVAAVGPAIGGCCYTVGDEVHRRFAANFAYAAELFHDEPDGLHLNLPEANRRQLADAGVTGVTVLAECTACARTNGQRKYFSHRAEGGFTGRAIGMIGIAHPAV